MRYTADEQGYLIKVNFGCYFGDCTEYTGEVPDGYETIEEWYEENCECVRSWKIVDGNLVGDASKNYKLQVLYEQESNDNAHITRKEMGMASTEEINPYTDLFPSHDTAGGYIVGVDETFNRVGNLPTEEVNLTLWEEQDLDLIELEFIGSNFLPNNATSSVNNGITYTQNKDKTINVSGTATDKSTLNLAGTDTSVRNILTLKQGVLVGGEEGNHIEPYEYLLFGLEGLSLEFYNYDGTDRTLIGTYSDGIIKVDEDINITQVVLVVDKGTTIDTTIKPMLQLVGLEHPILPMTKYKGNLFNYVDNFNSSINGLTNTINDDGSITVSGVPTGGYTQIVGRTDITNVLKNGERYKLSQSHSDANVYLEVRRRNKATGTLNYFQRDSSFVANTIDYTYDIALLTYTTSRWGTESKTITGFYQLEKGSTSTEFKPYNGRDEQYYVDGVSTQETRSGKNLFNEKKVNDKNGLTNVINSDGSITTTGTPTGNYSLITDKEDITDLLEDGETYTVSQKKYGIPLCIELSAKTQDGTNVYWKAYSSARTVTIDKTTYSNYYLCIVTGTIEDTGELNVTNKYMLCKGTDNATDSYEKYGVSPSPDYPSEIVNIYPAGTYNAVIDNRIYTFTIPEDLRSTPSVADRLWIDVNGDNGIDIERKVGRVVFDGDENISAVNIDSTITSRVEYHGFLSDELKSIGNCTKLICNRLTGIGNWNKDVEGIYLNNKAIVFRINKATIGTTKEEVNAWLSTHNIEVYHELATYITSFISSFSLEKFEYEEYKNNTTLIDLEGNAFTPDDKITIKDNQIILIKNDYFVNEIYQGEETYLGDTVMPRTYTPYTHAYCHQKVYLDFKYKDPRNIDITKITLEGLLSITNIESQYNFTSDDYTKIQNYIMETGDLTDEEIELYDVNGDGRITASDYVLIKNMVEGTSSSTIKGTFEINTTKSQRVLILRDENGKIKTSIGLNGATTPSISTEQLILNGTKQPKIMSGITLPEEVTEGAVFLLYDE